MHEILVRATDPAAPREVLGEGVFPSGSPLADAVALPAPPGWAAVASRPGRKRLLADGTVEVLAPTAPAPAYTPELRAADLASVKEAALTDPALAALLRLLGL